MTDVTTLVIIESWKKSLEELMDIVESAWDHNFGRIKKIQTSDETIYIFATGGWSENEDIISALNQNILFWSMCWWSSMRGGKHKFIVPFTDSNREE